MEKLEGTKITSPIKDQTIIMKNLTVLCSCDENNTATSLQVLLNMERYQQWNTVLEFII